MTDATECDMAVPRFEPLTTDRLRIRTVVSGDVDALHARRNDVEAAAFQAWELPYAREDAAELIETMVRLDGHPPGDGWLQLAVDDVRSGEPLGDLAVHFTFDGRCTEIGYTFASPYWGNGFATEAATALAAWLFETAGVSRVSASMHPDNAASIRVAERIGMEFEGRTKNSYWVGDENSDDVLYAMTPDSWRAWTQRGRSPVDTVELVPIDDSNLEAVEALATHRSQAHLVASVAGSFADAFVVMTDPDLRVTPWARAVVADSKIAGFVMVREPSPERPEGYLWRLLIDRMHQRRGIGTRVVDAVVAHCASMGASALTVSWAQGPGSPEPMYLGCGFVPTGEIDDGEVVARLEW